MATVNGLFKSNNVIRVIESIFLRNYSYYIHDTRFHLFTSVYAIIFSNCLELFEISINRPFQIQIPVKREIS